MRLVDASVIYRRERARDASISGIPGTAAYYFAAYPVICPLVVWPGGDSELSWNARTFSRSHIVYTSLAAAAAAGCLPPFCRVVARSYHPYIC